MCVTKQNPIHEIISHENSISPNFSTFEKCFPTSLNKQCWKRKKNIVMRHPHSQYLSHKTAIYFMSFAFFYFLFQRSSHHIIHTFDSRTKSFVKFSVVKCTYITYACVPIVLFYIEEVVDSSNYRIPKQLRFVLFIEF